MIAILGAGSLGRLWAARLPAGRVAFIPRPGIRPATAHVCYRWRSLDGSESRAQVPWLSPGETPELIIVTTKAGDAASAVAGILPQLPQDTPVVLFQNGLGSQQAVAAQWPHHCILAASTTEGANRPSPDLLVHAGKGETWIGPLTSPARATGAQILAPLDASGLTLHQEPDILHRLWQKLIINAGINPYTALLDCTNGDILEAPLYRNTIDALCRELALLMQADGQGEERPETLRQRIEAVARRTAGNTSSMRADILRGRPTEIHFINGYLVQRGKAHGIAVPVNQMLTEQVQQLSLHKQEQSNGQSPLEDIHPHRG